MRKALLLSVIVCAVTLLGRCHKAEPLDESAFDDRLSGGLATTLDNTSHALQNALDGLSARDARVHEIGDNTFEATFVAPPAKVFAGLGPVYNNVSCVNCHRNDGGGLPTAGLSNSGLLMRISIPGEDENGVPNPVPGIGVQVQDKAVIGAKPEATVNIGYEEQVFTYPDGRQVSLRKPSYSLSNPYVSLPADHMLSPRLAPPLIGMGLLESIPEETILSFVDAGDQNGDGVSGKANYVYDSYLKKKALGRFGLKANTPSLLVQTATAYQQDMGVTSFVQPQESSEGQEQQHVVTGYDPQPELADSLVNYVVFYMQTLAVPARRNVTDADVKAGEVLFNQVNCSACHRATMTTGTNVAIPQLSGQRIHPYTDLLVHDMGDGLADGRPDFMATGREWRTQPLWGLGLLEKTTGAAFYLHDGRARSIEEAVLWHDGEASKARQAFAQLSAAQRQQLLDFLSSL